ncbi:MAG: homoserine dehydrogenase [Lachnospiraceae bacterium]|jgi:homoserine dehydrogenase|nr:homoserine dehydrogenase [Lachnospiraceae bacterium]
MIKVAIMGYGTVGSGVYEVIRTNEKSIDKKVGQELRIKYVLDLREFPGDPVMEVLTHDFEDIINDEEVRIVAEVMGGLHPAYEFTRRCLEAGKSVCTSNKELVAEHGAELIQIAKDHQVNYLFEASVGGGIPIIRPLNSSLTADVILEVSGILNGTTNYMLTKMDREGLDYMDVLKEAQDKGYAELHPEADVEGWDACRKIAILTSLASGNQVDFHDIYTEGITKITSEDFLYAKKLNRSIKLLAISRKTGDTYCAMVSPALVHREHPLYVVNDVFNAVFVKGNMLGNSMFYGSGAGKLPTASAVAGDMVDAARHLGKIITLFWDPEKLTLAPMEQMTRRFFIRMKSDAEPEKLFGDGERIHAGISGEVGFITPVMTEAEFVEKAKGAEIISMIRVEG